MLSDYTENGLRMKRFVAILQILLFSFPLFAQVDYLDPVRSVDKYPGELGEYYRNVFSLLHTGFQKKPYACFTVIPSFSPEYAMSVEKRNGRTCLISNTLSRTYWQADKKMVKVNNHSVIISPSLYQSLGLIFRLVASQIQDMDGTAVGLDGTAYYVSSTDAQGHVMMGRKWMPQKEMLMGRLVLLCESAYLLSTGGNISEKTLAEEATALLKELQKRSKEQPNAHKRPIYMGIYTLGVQRSPNRKAVEKGPKFPHVTPERYVFEQVVYPKELLAKDIKGYVLCEFTIDKGGEILRPHILESTHPQFAEEVLRVVKQMPVWSPALAANQPLECNYILYAPFRVQDYKQRLLNGK